MKRIGSLLLVVGLSALGASAQTNVTTTAGTPGNLAKFTGPATVGNSVVVLKNGNVGIGTTSPLFPLVVTNATGFNSLPSEAFIETSDQAPFTAAIRALAGTSTDNLTFAIDGVTFSPNGYGVQGNHASSGGGFGGGVKGQTSATDGFNFGVWGDYLGTTGSGAGVMGTTASPDGNGGLETSLPVRVQRPPCLGNKQR
jgi:hypothetical protein